MNTADGLLSLTVQKKFESKKVTKLAGVWSKHNQWQRLEDGDWLSLTVGWTNYSKGGIKNDRAKLFWAIANGETQDHKVLLRDSEQLFTKMSSL